MSSDGRPEQTEEAADPADAAPACVALVPTVTSARWPQAVNSPRPSPIFVTHLIATAEQVPQTRSLRRATPADAQAAYRPHQLKRSGHTSQFI
jgi:hypothetical protein